jgi:hypothetical protein
MAPHRRKNKFSDVLDPIGLAPDTFALNLADGSMFPNPALPRAEAQAAKKTINRLKLDSPGHRAMRLRHFNLYARGGIDSQTLKELSPFVWYEANRQNLL